VRAPTPRARRTTWTLDEHHGVAVAVVVAADPTGPGVAPRPELTAAPRTTQDATNKESVDLEQVRTYDQQRVPPSTKRRPSHPAKDSGGPLRFQDVVTLSSPTKKGNPSGLPKTHHHRQ